MKTVNFIVEQMFEHPKDDNNKTEHIYYDKFFFNTAICLRKEKLDINHWGLPNKTLMLHFTKGNLVNLLLKNDYKGQDNTFYLLNIRQNDDIENFDWNSLSEDCLNFLRSTEIPVLFWYPLESIANINIEVFKRIIEHRDNLNLKNKIVILSLSVFKDLRGNTVLFSDIDIKLKDVKLVRSLGFLIRYSSKNIVGRSVIDIFRQQNKIISSAEELYYMPKKFNFLCMNNKPSFNRVLMLQWLWSAKKRTLWENNLITCRHNPNDWPNFNLTILSRIAGSLYSQKTSLNNKELNFILETFNVHIPSVLSSYAGNDPLVLFLKNYYYQVLNSNIYPQTLLEFDIYQDNLNDGFRKLWFKQSLFSLITESYIDKVSTNLETPMLTEKTVKAIMNFHPFVIFAHGYSHKLLNEYGFRTFEYLIDLPKDGDIGNSTLIERFYTLANCLENFTPYSIDIGRLKKDAIHNYNHLVNIDWCGKQIQTLIDETNS